MPKRTRFAAVCCAALLIFALTFSAFFIAAESSHDCGGDHCSICHQIQICQTLLEQFSTSPSAPVGTWAPCTFALLIVLWTPSIFVAASPVLLRVKLLN